MPEHFLTLSRSRMFSEYEKSTASLSGYEMKADFSAESVEKQDNFTLLSELKMCTSTQSLELTDGNTKERWFLYVFQPWHDHVFMRTFFSVAIRVHPTLKMSKSCLIFSIWCFKLKVVTSLQKMLVESKGHFLPTVSASSLLLFSSFASSSLSALFDNRTEFNDWFNLTQTYAYNRFRQPFTKLVRSVCSKLTPSQTHPSVLS